MIAGREFKLRNALKPIRDSYDVILIDCPPSLNMLTLNALVAADSVMVPMQCEYYALEGLTRADPDHRADPRSTSIRRSRSRALLRTMFDPRNNLANEVSAQLIEHFGDKVFRTLIPAQCAPGRGAELRPAGAVPRQRFARRAGLSGARRRNDPPRASMPAASRIILAYRFRQTTNDRQEAALGRGLAGLLAPARQRATRRRPRRPAPPAADRRAHAPAARSAAARQVSAAHRHAARVADRTRRLDQGPGASCSPSWFGRSAQPGDRARANRSATRSSPANAAGAPRNWRAWPRFPAVIRDVPDEAAVAMALIENIQRENLNPLEEARALSRLIDEFGLTHQAGRRSGGPLARRRVSNLLRLMELADEVKTLVGAARTRDGPRAGAAWPDHPPPADRGRRAGREEGPLGARDRGAGAPPDRRRRRRADAAPVVDADMRRLGTGIGEKARRQGGVQARFAHGSGQLVISYNSQDELDGILAHIQ